MRHMGRRHWGTGSVSYRKSEGRWVASVSLGTASGQRVRRVYYARTRKAALRELDDARRRVRLALSPTGERMTVGEYLAAWLRDIQSSVAPSTWVSYEGHVRNHLAPLHAAPLDGLTAPQVRAWLRGLEEAENPLSTRTIRLSLLVLQMALRQAVQDGLLERNPAEHIKGPKLVQRPAAFWDEGEIRTFLAAVDGEPYEALFKLAIGTGMRKGEIVNLTWGDIDLNSGTAVVQKAKTVTGRRTVPLPEFVVDALRGLPKGSVFVFPSTTGNRLDAGRPNDWLNEAIRKTELPRLTFHGLRHTAISLMAVEGVPITTTMAIVGHKTMRMTAERYSHVPDKSKREAMEKVGRALG